MYHVSWHAGNRVPWVARLDLSLSPILLILSCFLQQLLQLFDAALSEKWTVGLHHAMAPLSSLRYPWHEEMLLKPSKICAAQIAVQLAQIRKKIPEELVEQIRRLKNYQRREAVRFDWTEAKERVAAREFELKEVSSTLFCQRAGCLSSFHVVKSA